ncbi:MAG: DHA1 family inner membrane transport protein [Halieaceae bacterium]
MNARLLSLAFAPFAFGTSAFIYIGLIGPMARDLGVSVAAVGQLQTAFALACGIGGPVLARLLAQYDRKRLLLAVLTILLAMNIASALAPDIGTIVVIRFACGLFAALTLPLASTLAVSNVSEQQRPTALASVLAGYTLAFLIGMPLGSIIGDALGWQAAFWFAAGITGMALIVIAVAAPVHVHVPPTGAAGFRAALVGDNPLYMSITFLTFTATFITVSFIGPVITESTGLRGATIGGVQLSTGIGSLLGLPVGAAMARMAPRRALLILLAASCLTQVLFSVGMLLDLRGGNLPLLLLTMTLGSASLFASTPIIQMRLAAAAGPAATIAFALNGSMIFLGQGIGASVGGAIINSIGLAFTGLAGAVAGLLAMLLISRSRKPQESIVLASAT